MNIPTFSVYKSDPYLPLWRTSGKVLYCVNHMIDNNITHEGWIIYRYFDEQGLQQETLTSIFHETNMSNHIYQQSTKLYHSFSNLIIDYPEILSI